MIVKSLHTKIYMSNMIIIYASRKISLKYKVRKCVNAGYNCSYQKRREYKGDDGALVVEPENVIVDPHMVKFHKSLNLLE
jgi:hypothetical protein